MNLEDFIPKWVQETEFFVTNDHIILLQNMMVSWDDNRGGTPCVDNLQPYGSTCFLCDVARILGIKPKLDLTTKKTSFTEEQLEYMKKTHRETQIVLQIFLKTGKMEPGSYKHDGTYEWRKV